MLFAYIDESKENNAFFVYSALIVNGDRWASVFNKVRDFRRHLRQKHGISMAQELYASHFAAFVRVASPALLAEFCCKSEFQTVQNIDIFRTLLVGAVLGLIVATTAFSHSQFTRRYARQNLMFGSLSFSISLGLVIAALAIGLS